MSGRHHQPVTNQLRSPYTPERMAGTNAAWRYSNTTCTARRLPTSSTTRGRP